MASCSIITQSTVFFAESSSSQPAYLNPTDNFLSEKQSAEGWIYQNCAVFKTFKDYFPTLSIFMG